MPTEIEWCSETWNPVTGCDRVSAGCDNCYARRIANRLRGRYGYPKDNPFKVTLHPDRLEQPLHWRKPRTIFVCSMGDFFHPEVPLQFQAEALRVMVKCPQHIFIILTKREKQLAIFNEVCGWSKKAYPNIWPGVSVEDQPTADRRIPELLKVDAAVRLVSIEPMLGNIVLPSDWSCPNCGLVCDERVKNDETCMVCGAPCKIDIDLDWVICGGETGPGARPMNPEWSRKVRDDCVAAGVPFFFKSWGEYRFVNPMDEVQPNYQMMMMHHHTNPSDTKFRRVDKKQAGRTLDGRTWDQVPEV